MKQNVSVHSVICFTLLFECVLQGNVVYRRLVQGVNCHLGSGCLTRLAAGLLLLLGHGVWDEAWDMFRVRVDAKLGRGLGWISFSNGVQEEGVRGDGGVGLCPSARMAATGVHNKVERVFLVMHIGFVGV